MNGKDIYVNLDWQAWMIAQFLYMICMMLKCCIYEQEIHFITGHINPSSSVDAGEVKELKMKPMIVK